MPPEPLSLPCSLDADFGRAHGFRMTLEDTLDRSADAGPHAVAELFAEAPGTVSDVLGLATRRDPVRIATVVTCPDAPFLLHHGLVTDLIVGLTTVVDREDPNRERPDDDLRAVVLRGVYADWSDGWRIHVTPPRDAFAGMEVLHTRAEVWASIARRWVAVEVTLTARGDDDRLVLAAPPLEAPVVEKNAPLHTGFRLVAATVDGRSADVVLGAGGYLVVGGLGRGVAQVRLRYEGPLPLVGDNQADARVLEVHRWLPVLPFAAPGRVEVAVHHPAGDTLVSSLPAAGAPRPSADGWVTERLVGLTDRDPSLLLLDDAPVSRTWSAGGAELELLASAPLSLDDCAPAFERIVARLAPLGPIGKVRVLAVPAVFGRHGRRAGDLVLLLRTKLLDLCTPERAGSAEVRRNRDDAVTLVAHELAHGWFGRRVRAADDEAAAWWESAAEYVSSWTLDDDAAAALRRGWLEGYAEQAHRDLFAMAQRIPTQGPLRDALSYNKGALLLTALEDRIGRDRVAAVLRHLVASRDGELGSWLDVVAATQEVAGSAAARWLHAWLFAVGAPELSITDLETSPSHLSFTIAQDSTFDATIDVALMRGDTLLAHSRVPLSGPRTPVILDRPPGTGRIVLDPWSRLPRFGIAEATVHGTVR